MKRIYEGTYPSQREMAKIHVEIFKVFHRTTSTISNKPCTQLLWVKRIICIFHSNTLNQGSGYSIDSFA